MGFLGRQWYDSPTEWHLNYTYLHLAISCILPVLYPETMLATRINTCGV